MKRIKLLFSLLLALSMYACNRNSDTNKEKNQFEKAEYAELFEINKEETYTELYVYSKEKKRKTKYILTSDRNQVKANDAVIIEVPVERIICLSTTHLGFLNRLGEQARVIGAGGTDYLYDSALRKAVKDGKISDIGYEGNLNREKIIELQPDLLSLYEIAGENNSSAAMAKRYGLPHILIYEYAEASVLGQAEWIKVFGLLTGTEKRADSIFNEIKTKYEQLKQPVENVNKKPSVLLNMPWKGTWYIPSGQSNIAELINDAGGNYLWWELEGRHNRPMNIETVYEKAEDADLWLNPGQAESIEDIVTVDNRLANLKAMKTGNIYNRNARVSPTGGNDFMESGVVYPDRILSDLITILHPDAHMDSLFYYKKLE